MFNVIRLGSHYAKTHFGNQDVFLVRPHIQLPNSLVQKWGKEYFALRNFSESEVKEMCFNSDENRVFYIYGECLVDRHEVNYIKAFKRQADVQATYWITTMVAIDHVIDNSSIIRTNPNSKSKIFSMAFNRKDPKMFEATLILQAGDIIVKGNWQTKFCPKENPFLNVWIPCDPVEHPSI